MMIRRLVEWCVPERALHHLGGWRGPFTQAIEYEMLLMAEQVNADFWQDFNRLMWGSSDGRPVTGITPLTTTFDAEWFSG